MVSRRYPTQIVQAAVMASLIVGLSGCGEVSKGDQRPADSTPTATSGSHHASESPEPTTTPSSTAADSDQLDCAAPGFELITLDLTNPNQVWDRPATVDGTPFRIGTVRIRIQNNSRHKILTSGAWIDIAYRDSAGVIHLESQAPFRGIRESSVPRLDLLHERAETVRGHDAIEFSEYLGTTSFTDGSPPWINTHTIRWAFENPDLENACQQQQAQDSPPHR